MSPDILNVRVKHKGHHYSPLFYFILSILCKHLKYISTYLFILFQQLARITKALDPENTGFINFDQFCDGISQISSLQGLSLNEVASDLTRRSRENSLVEDSDRRSLVRIHFLEAEIIAIINTNANKINLYFSSVENERQIRFLFPIFLA